MSGRDAPMVFLVPAEHLGRTVDVMPERISAAQNDWIGLTREVLKKKRKAAAQGYRSPVPLADGGTDAKPFGAEHCPVQHELHANGWLLKWPATAILRNVRPGAWVLKTSTNFNFYAYHPQTSFPEAGEAEAISVDVGWLVVTPPGWSVLIKNVPNSLRGSPAGLSLAEGVVRTDQVTTPLVTHAFVQPNAPREIKIKRGEPMAMLFPFRREEIGLAVLDERAFVEEANALARKNHEAFAQGAGGYRKQYVEGDAGATPLYERLRKAWEEREAAGGKPEGQPE